MASSKGLESIIGACEVHKTGELKLLIKQKLEEDQTCKVPVRAGCCKRFTDPRKSQTISYLPPKSK